MSLKSCNLPYRLAVACLCVGASAQWVFAKSGIGILVYPIQHSPQIVPPCNATQITTFVMAIENTNDKCDEDVIIWHEGLISDPAGAFEFPLQTRLSTLFVLAP